MFNVIFISVYTSYCIISHSIKNIYNSECFIGDQLVNMKNRILSKFSDVLRIDCFTARGEKSCVRKITDWWPALWRPVLNQLHVQSFSFNFLLSLVLTKMLQIFTTQTIQLMKTIPALHNLSPYCIYKNSISSVPYVPGTYPA